MDALDVFRVGAEVGGVVDFVLEELGLGLLASNFSWTEKKGGEGQEERGLTMPVTLLAMKSAGWFLLSFDRRK